MTGGLTRSAFCARRSCRNFTDDKSHGRTSMKMGHRRLNILLFATALLFGAAALPLAQAMPVVIQHNMTFFALFGLDVNREFQYPRYFAMQPAGGPNPSAAFSQGFF